MIGQTAAVYVEPWQPQIGQRVRIRLSGECRYHELNCAPVPAEVVKRAREAGLFGHQDLIESYGTEEGERWYRYGAGHRYVVRFDQPILNYLLTRVLGKALHRAMAEDDDMFAAMELEPTEEPL